MTRLDIALERIQAGDLTGYDLLLQIIADALAEL